MNAKFFDLNQEKQDRIINAALKVFALNGYQHASTDDIVKEAHISKGLLFHYFDSKIGVYSFLYDYCTKLLSLELSSAIDPSETSYFEIRRQMEAAKLQALKSYPYMLLFMNRSQRETVPEALIETEEARNTYNTNYNSILSRADYSSIFLKKNSEEFLKMLEYTLSHILEAALLDDSFNAEMNYEESIKYINLIEKAI